MKEDSLLDEVINLLKLKLICDIDDSPLSQAEFLELQKKILISKIFRIPYGYVRLPEGRRTVYVKHKIEKRMPQIQKYIQQLGIQLKIDI